jgi:hypothetical protein
LLLGTLFCTLIWLGAKGMYSWYID